LNFDCTEINAISALSEILLPCSHFSNIHFDLPSHHPSLTT
jgi:hypothetical protein